MNYRRLGILLIVFGVLAAALMVFLGGVSQRRVLSTFGRANVGCQYTFSFQDTGTYFVFVETGVERVVDASCPPTERGEVLEVVVSSGSNEIPMVEDPSIEYEYGGATGRSIRRFEIAAPGTYQLSVNGPNSGEIVAIGLNPKSSGSSWNLAAGIIGGLSVIAGIGLLVGKTLREARDDEDDDDEEELEASERRRSAAAASKSSDAPFLPAGAVEEARRRKAAAAKQGSSRTGRLQSTVTTPPVVSSGSTNAGGRRSRSASVIDVDALVSEHVEARDRARLGRDSRARDRSIPPSWRPTMEDAIDFDAVRPPTGGPRSTSPRSRAGGRRTGVDDPRRSGRPGLFDDPADWYDDDTRAYPGPEYGDSGYGDYELDGYDYYDEYGYPIYDYSDDGGYGGPGGYPDYDGYDDLDGYGAYGQGVDRGFARGDRYPPPASQRQGMAPRPMPRAPRVSDPRMRGRGSPYGDRYPARRGGPSNDIGPGRQSGDRRKPIPRARSARVAPMPSATSDDRERHVVDPFFDDRSLDDRYLTQLPTSERRQAAGASARGHDDEVTFDDGWDSSPARTRERQRPPGFPNYRPLPTYLGQRGIESFPPPGAQGVARVDDIGRDYSGDEYPEDWDSGPIPQPWGDGAEVQDEWHTDGDDTSSFRWWSPPEAPAPAQPESQPQPQTPASSDTQSGN